MAVSRELQRLIQRPLPLRLQRRRQRRQFPNPTIEDETDHPRGQALGLLHPDLERAAEVPQLRYKKQHSHIRMLYAKPSFPRMSTSNHLNPHLRRHCSHKSAHHRILAVVEDFPPSSSGFSSSCKSCSAVFPGFFSPVLPSFTRQFFQLCSPAVFPSCSRSSAQQFRVCPALANAS